MVGLTSFGYENPANEPSELSTSPPPSPTMHIHEERPAEQINCAPASIQLLRHQISGPITLLTSSVLNDLIESVLRD
jgi:hypothetical protein